MRIVDRYIFRQTLIATVFVTLVLAALIFLTQSLRFLDLVMNAGASGFFIWLQTLLYLPGFFEIILPIGMVASVLFVYNRLTTDSELIVLRALGFSPFRLARPALGLAIFLGVSLFGIMGWVSPVSRAEAVTMRQSIQTQMTSLIFREGIFNEAGPNVMVYIRDRDAQGNLHGLIIHDSRPDKKMHSDSNDGKILPSKNKAKNTLQNTLEEPSNTKPPSTVIARRGVLVSTPTGQQVMVYDGSRQEIDPKTGAMRRLDFDQYTIDLPQDDKTTEARSPEPEERTNGELMTAISDKSTDRQERREFRVELQKRFLVPFLVPGFALVGLSLLLIGGLDRRGQGKRIVVAITVVVALEILFLTSYNVSKQSVIGFPMMLLTVLVPYVGAIIIFLQNDLLKRGKLIA